MTEVGRQVLFQKGCSQRVRIWYAGHLRGINGVLTFGWQGEPQTRIQKDIIVPTTIIEVTDDTAD